MTADYKIDTYGLPMSITGQFLRHPRTTGAIAASSRRLARTMTGDLGIERASLVVELGPGTGAITDAILDRLPPGGRLVAVELNPTLASGLAHRYRNRPVDVVTGHAAGLADLLDARADAVVSGLPWAAMSREEQRRILDAIDRVLCPRGGFATFAYVHAAGLGPARRFARQLTERYPTVARTRVAWANLPPAFVWQARTTHP
jgi:phosphatidylethanolamine/phosphatidyl-N-methylethanolamine N-methyltransferase